MVIKVILENGNYLDGDDREAVIDAANRDLTSFKFKGQTIHILEDKRDVDRVIKVRVV